MNRRTQLNLILAASAIVLTALLWLSQPQPPEPEPPLLDVAGERIDRIEIHPGGGRPAIVLVRGPHGWRLTQPVDARADASRVEDLLAMAAAIPARRYAAGEIDAEQAGLAPPRATIRFGDAPVMAIGARTPIDGRKDTRYVRVGDTVALVALPNAAVVDLNWPRWIDPHLLAPDARLEALQLPGLTLTRADTGGWLVSPNSRDRGADAAQFTIDAWRRARAMRITRARDKPAMADVKLVFADGRSRRLEVVARQPQLLLRDPALGITYHLPSNMAAPLLDMRHPATALNRMGNPANARTRQPRNKQPSQAARTRP